VFIDAQTARAPNIIEDVVPKYLSVQVEGNYCPYRSPDHAHHCNPSGLILVDHGNPASPAPPVQPRVRRTLIELARNLRSQSPPVPNTPRTTAPKKRFTLPALAVRSGTGTQLMKRPKKPRSQTVPVPSVSRATASQRRFTLPLHRTSRRSREQSVDPRPEVQGRGAESAIVRSSWGWKVLWVVVKALGKFLRVRKLPGIDRRLSAPHDSDPSEWECVIGGLIDVIFSDRDEVKAIGQLSGGDAQVFTDMVYEVHLCVLSSPKTKCTNFSSGLGLPRSRAKGELSTNFVQDLWPSGPTSEITEHYSFLGSSGSPPVPGRVCRCVEG